MSTHPTKPEGEARNPKPKVGPGSKPRVLSEDEIDQLKRLSPMLSNQQLADYFMVSYQTFYNILERQPEVQTILRYGKALLSSDIQNKLFELARGGNVASICFFLKTQNQWRETDRLEIITEEKPTIKTLVDVFEQVGDNIEDAAVVDGINIEDNSNEGEE